MFGFGNKKRIKELERQADYLIDRYSAMNSKIETEELFENNKELCKCDSCHIEAGSKEISVVLNNEVVAKMPQKIRITAKEAIGKIIEHLGIEFDTEPAVEAQTIIKIKEASEEKP